MSATMAGAFKAYIEAAGLALSAYRDGAPVDAEGAVVVPYPYVVVQEGIGYDAELHGDYADPDAHDGTTELVQIDLWQQARRTDPDRPGRTIVAERYDLPDQLDKLLRGALGLQPHAPWRVYGVTVRGAQRAPIANNLIRHTWTVAVRRDTTRRA